MYVGLGEIPCSPLAGFFIHFLYVVSLSSGPDFRCFCQFVWMHFFLLCTVRFWVPSYDGVLPAVCVLISQFCCATGGYVFGECGSMNLLVWNPLWYWCYAGGGIIPLLLVVLHVSDFLLFALLLCFRGQIVVLYKNKSSWIA
jgi:hypothetical protein